MTRRKFAVISNYGSESKTFSECRKNWSFYSSQFPKVPFYIFREAIEETSSGIAFDGQDYVITLDQKKYPVESHSTYHENSTWSVTQLRRIFERWTQQIKYVITHHPDCYVVYTNITAFFSFQAIEELLSHLPSEHVYAGWPLLYRPEKLLYHSGSGILLSPDVARILVERASGFNYLGTEAGDLVWGRLLKDVPRTVLAFAQITPQDLKTTNFVEQIRFIDRYIEQGHYLFRIKNSGLATPREIIDPPLQLYTMIQSLKDVPDKITRQLAATNLAREQIQNGHGITIIG
jgi:hypothetical protein